MPESGPQALEPGMQALGAPLVSPGVIEQVDHLQRDGFDVELVPCPPRYRRPPDVQRAVESAVEELSGRADGQRVLFDPQIHPGASAWFALTKRAIALHTLYNIGDIERLGDGINGHAFDIPCIDGRSARSVLFAEKSPQSASRILDSYERFLAAPVDDDEDIFGLTSRDYLTEVVDSRAVQTRADVAVQVVKEHLLESPSRESEITSASLACGAAGPVLKMVEQLASEGVSFVKVAMVDHDAMALACARQLADSSDVSQRVELHHRDLFKEDLCEYIPPGSVDVLDLLGLFEYLPERISLAGIFPYHPARDLLAGVRAIMRPRGLIVLGNMLDERPQQRFFDKVWPRLHQRTIPQVLALIEDAGYDLRDVSVRVPSAEGVYAVYSIRVRDPRDRSRLRPVQALGRWTVRTLHRY
jgi:hypothetical protein